MQKRKVKEIAFSNCLKCNSTHTLTNFSTRITTDSKVTKSQESMTTTIQPSGQLGYETRTKWEGEQYCGLSEQVLLNPDGSRSESLAIFKKNKIVNVMSDKYHVFANADLAEMLDEVAKDVGAVPLNKENGLGKWGKSHGNIIEDTKYGTRALISYKFPDLAVDITGAGDANLPTFSGSNSEDGRGGALKILGGFLRTYCDNLQYTFVPASEIKGLNSAKHLWNSEKHQQVNPAIEAKVNQINVAVKDLTTEPRFYTKHSKQVKDLESIRASIKQAVEFIKVDNEFVANRYKELYKLKLNSYLATELVNNLPKNLYEVVPSLEVDKEGKLTFDEKLNDWDVYNTLTKELTYNDNSSKTFGSVLLNQRKVESIFIREPIEVLAQ